MSILACPFTWRSERPGRLERKLIAARRIALGMPFYEVRRCSDLSPQECEEWFGDDRFFDLIDGYRQLNAKSEEERYQMALQQAYDMIEDGITTDQFCMMAFMLMENGDGLNIPELMARKYGVGSPLTPKFNAEQARKRGREDAARAVAAMEAARFNENVTIEEVLASLVPQPSGEAGTESDENETGRPKPPR